MIYSKKSALNSRELCTCNVPEYTTSIIERAKVTNPPERPFHMWFAFCSTIGSVGSSTFAETRDGQAWCKILCGPVERRPRLPPWSDWSLIDIHPLGCFTSQRTPVRYFLCGCTNSWLVVASRFGSSFSGDAGRRHSPEAHSPSPDSRVNSLIGCRHPRGSRRNPNDLLSSPLNSELFIFGESKDRPIPLAALHDNLTNDFATNRAHI